MVRKVNGMVVSLSLYSEVLLSISGDIFQCGLSIDIAKFDLFDDIMSFVKSFTIIVPTVLQN